MQSVMVTLDRPISQFVDYRSRERHTSLHERYDRYQRGDISFGRLAQDLGITTWELSHLLEERGWPAHNLPAAVASGRQPSLHEETAAYDFQNASRTSDEPVK